VLVISEVEDRFAAGATVWLEDGRTLTIDASRRISSTHARAIRWGSHPVAVGLPEKP